MSLLTQASLVLTPTAYKANKLYSIIPSSGNGDMITTRATTATRVNSSGLVENVATGIPRLDYTGSVPSILLEPQRTNLNTNYLGSTGWSGTMSSTSFNFGISPDGTQNSTALINSGVFNRAFNKTFTLTSGLAYTFSVYVKLNAGTITTNTALIEIYGSTSALVYMNDLTNQWKRYSVTLIPSATQTHTLEIRTDVASTLEVYGLQLEVGSYATSVIPTTTSTVTRNLDSISLSNIYTNNLITSAGGTWFVELRNNVQLSRDSSGQGGFILSTGTNTISGDGFNIRHTGGNTRLAIQTYISGITAAITYIPTDNSKIAIKWNGTTADYFINGIKLISGFSFSPTDLQFMYGNGGQVPKYINSTMLFPTPLTDAECITLTTL